MIVNKRIPTIMSFSPNGGPKTLQYQRFFKFGMMGTVQYRFAETLTLTLTLNPNFGESGRHHGDMGYVQISKLPRIDCVQLFAMIPIIYL